MRIALILNLIAVEILLVLVHLAVYATIAAFFGVGSAALLIVFILLAFSFFVAVLVTRGHRAKWLDWYYTLAAYWFGLVNFLFGGVVAAFFILSECYARNIFIPAAPVVGTSLAAFFLLHLYGTWTAQRAEITRVAITLPGLPDAWKGKKIAFVSDLHLGNIWKERFAAKVARKINALAPEAILVGGDLYDGPACDTQKIIEPLRGLKAPQGTFFITGNHEYYMAATAPALAAIRGIGMRILDNEKVDLGGLTVAGVDYARTRKKDELKSALAAMNLSAAAGPVILLRHEPDNLDAARDAGVALTLAGHTHQGQVIPLNFITRTMYHGFDYGLKRLGDMQVYTSSGVGTWGPPLRLGTRSEIVLIELR